MKSYVIGVDIGGTSVKMGLFEESGRVVHKWSIPTRKVKNGTYILSNTAASIEQVLEEKKISKGDIKGIGIDVPGPVLADGRVNKCANLGWGVVSVPEKMSKLIKIDHIKAINDANAAALGEMWQGSGKDEKNMVMVTLGTGVGGGVIVNGKIVSGSFGAAGEIGHIQVSFEEEESCGCGKKGCLEQYASASGIVRTAKKKLLKDGSRKDGTGEKKSVLNDLEEITAKDVFDAAKAGDELALEVVDDACDKLARAFSYISAVTDPKVYVIGGGVSNAGEFLITKIEQYYKKYAFHASKDARFTLAKLGNDAGIYGAAKLVL